MEPLTIALVVLVVAGVWAVVELALTLRRTRQSVTELTDTVNDTIGEVRPVIAKLDGAVDELGPATKQVEPILEKASTTVDLVNVDLVRLEGILSDVNTVTGTGARASAAVSGAADAVASGVAGVAAKVAGKVAGKAQAKISDAGHEPAHLAAPGQGDDAQAGERAADEPVVERVSGDAGYFTYPTTGAVQDDSAAGDGTDDASEAGSGKAATTEGTAGTAPAEDGSED